jgi:hypothetical protein
MNGNTAEERTWDAIMAWVRSGGLLLSPDGMGRLRTVEGDEEPHERLFGAGARSGKGRTVTFSGFGQTAPYREFVTRELAKASSLSAGTRAMIAGDGKEDGVYVTLCAPNELLWLNMTKQPVRKGAATVPAFGIAASRP